MSLNNKHLNVKSKKLNIGALNVRGCQEKHQQTIIAKDDLRNDLDIIGISETHLKGQGLEEIHTTINDNKDAPKHGDYLLFYTGSETNTHHGIGLLINKHLEPNFERISDWIYAAPKFV